MGILDDAIREHLDLKRRQGAEDDELAAPRGRGVRPAEPAGRPGFPRAEPGREQGAATSRRPVEERRRAGARAPSRRRADARGEPPPTSEPRSRRPPRRRPRRRTAERARAAERPPPGLSDEPRRRARRSSSTTTWTRTAAELEAPARSATVDEPRRPSPSRARRAGGRSRPATREPPIESLDTVEHHFEGAIEDTGEARGRRGRARRGADAVEPEAERGERGRGRARGDAGVPARPARGRRALVRAGRAEGLRLLARGRLASLM